MRLSNIAAIIENDLRVLKRNKWKAVELLYFPITTNLIWGLFALFSRQYASQAGLIVLIANMFWSFAHLAQNEANMLVMEDLWSLSIKHIITAGVTPFEYMAAKLFSSGILAALIGIILIFISNAFGAPLLANWQTVSILGGIALLGSLALAVVISGIVICSGKEYGFLSWTSLELFVFFSAPFYSPQILPTVLQWITAIMPFTSLFEAARDLATTTAIPTSLLWHAFFSCLAYFVLAWPFYFWCFRRAKRTGMLARIAS